MIPMGILSFDRVPPVASFTSPAAGNVSGTINVTASVTDNDKVASVQFKIDGVNLGAAQTVAPFTLTHDTHLLTAAAHTYSAVCVDREGNTTTITRGVTVTNSIPSSADLVFGEWQPSDGGGGYIAGNRTIGSSNANRWSDDYHWSNWSDKATHPLPSNPDSTHYQMRVQAGIASGGRMEGGTAGNHIHLAMEVAGTEYDAYDNTYSGFGPQQFGLVAPVNVNGGEAVRFAKWETSPGTNTSFTQGVVAHCDFVLKGGYLS